MRRSTRFAFRFVPILVGLGLTMGSGAKAQEWTRFRGPNGTGVSDAKSIPTTFSEADYNWRIELPGYGHSQPVIWGQKIFVTSAPEDGSARHVSCVSVENGKILWTKSFEATSYHNHERSSYASSTPALDESRVYVTFQTGNRAFLAALDHDGELVWTHDLGTYDSQHGYGASPIVYKDLLVFPFEQIAREGKPSPSYVIALDRATGDLVWKTMRRSRRAAYGTPCVRRGREGRDELVFTSGACGIYALDAETGKLNWEAPDVFRMRSVSSPVLASGLVIGACGSGGGGNYLVAVRPDGKGDVSDTHVLYTIKKAAPYVPTSVALGDKLFFVSDKGGIVTCLRASTGEEIWQGRVDENANHSASPVIIDDRLFLVSHEGEVTVLDTKDEFRILARNDIGELSRTTPAVAGGRLYLRTTKHLISLGSPEKVAARVDGE